MKTILCAVDYSESAVTALKYAHALSTKIAAKLFVIHLFDFPTLGSHLDEPFFLLEEETSKKQQAKLKKFCKSHFGNDLRKMNIETEAIEDSSVVDGIVSKAVELQAYIIVTGMKGEHKFKDFIMGNTTRQLLGKAPCPVLAIPEDVVLGEIKTVVYATDYEKEDIYAINKLTEIVKPFKSNIKIVHISEEDEYDGELSMDWFKELLKQQVHYKKIDFKAVSSDDIFDSLKTYLEDVDADLVVMMEREKTGFIKKMFHRDLVKRMESFGNIAFISFNEINYS